MAGYTTFGAVTQAGSGIDPRIMREVAVAMVDAVADVQTKFKPGCTRCDAAKRGEGSCGIHWRDGALREVGAKDAVTDHTFRTKYRTSGLSPNSRCELCGKTREQHQPESAKDAEDARAVFHEKTDNLKKKLLELINNPAKRYSPEGDALHKKLTAQIRKLENEYFRR